MIANKFDLGQVLATPRALSLLEESGESAATFLRQLEPLDHHGSCR